MKEVSIPLNAQASYYVYDESIKSMSFYFDSDGVDRNQEVTFWVKGKNITYATMGGSTSSQIENGYYFYDSSIREKPNLKVVANVGDYIIIGSTLVKGQKAKELKVNANEMVVASKNEVCFHLKATDRLSFITGKIYTKRAKTFLTDESCRTILEIEGKKYENEITDGIINDINILGLSKVQNGYYCVGKQEKNDQFMVFSLQMRKEQTNPAQVYLPPLLPGEIKRHILLNGQMAIFYGSKPNDDAKEVNFNIKAYKGFPQTYSLNCTTFPYCHYTENSVENKKFIYPSNMVTTYSFYLNALDDSVRNFNPISSFQPLIIVYCGKGGKEDEIFGEAQFCEFETTYFTDKDTIKLYEGCSFSQFFDSNGVGKYEINLKNDDIDQINLDFLLFSGDADIVLPDTFTGENANKYYLSNKIFYSIRFMLDKPDSFEFYINTTEAAFYMVQYKLLKNGISIEDMNILESGINYITSKAYGGVFDQNPKHLEFLNLNYEFSQPYLVTLYSPNCIFDVEIEKKRYKR